MIEHISTIISNIENDDLNMSIKEEKTERDLEP